MNKVTLHDIAEAAGVHPSTVSRALDPSKATMVNAQTRASVLKAAKELGYSPDALASGLRTGRTETLGVVVADLSNPFIAPVVRGIENALEGRNMMALIAETQDDHGRFNRVIDHFLRRRVDAIITTGARLGDEAALTKTAKMVPVVAAVRRVDSKGIPSVAHADFEGGVLVAEHLLSLGHTQLGQLRGPRDVSSFKNRAEGFASAVTAGGGQVIDVDDTASHPSVAEGSRLMAAMLEEAAEVPTAIFAHNDLMAMGALQVMSRAGLRCPEDIAIAGYNDTPTTAFLDPPLTSVRFPGYEIGRMAADMAVMMIEAPDSQPPDVYLPPLLVPRTSTLGRERYADILPNT